MSADLRSAFHAYGWSLLGEIASRLIQPVMLVVLARLLVPEDFGVVAAATVVISLLQVFWDTGLTRTIVQGQSEEASAINFVLTCNVLLSLLMAGLAAWLAPAVAAFFNDPRITAVVRVLAVFVPVTALSAVYTAVLYRRVRFRSLFWVRTASALAGGCASVALALSGWSYWALVAGTLLTQLLQLAMLRYVSNWAYSRPSRAEGYRAIVRFGGWALASGLLGWAYGWLDAIIVGRYLGSVDMAVYRTGNSLVIALLGTAFAPLLPVMYGLFSRLQNSPQFVRSTLETVTHAIALVAVPLGIGLYAFGRPFGDAVLGPEWAGIGSVIAVLGASHAIAWLVGVNAEVYRALGRPHVETAVTTLMICIYVPVYLIAVRQGLEAFLWCRLALSTAAVLVHVIFCRVITGIRMAHWMRIAAGSALVAAAATAAGGGLLQLGKGQVWVLLAAIIFSAVVYVVLIYVVEGRFIRRFLGIGASTIRRNA